MQMSKQIDAVFDFLCPYCYEGIGQFISILPEYSDIEVVWHPCEAHPRPEFATQHSDLAAAAFFAVRDAGGDIIPFITKVYKTWFVDKERIDDMDLLATIAAECGADREEVYNALKDGKYADEVNDSNIYAWDTLGLEAVPSYICGDESACSKGGRLVPIEKVKELISC